MPAPSESDGVLASLFPSHLTTLRDCRKPPSEPKTWVEIDDLELENLDTGQFVPVVERRERGRHPDMPDSISYFVRIDNCTPNAAAPFRLVAVFDASTMVPGTAAAQRRPRPFLVQWFRNDDMHLPPRRCVGPPDSERGP